MSSFPCDDCLDDLLDAYTDERLPDLCILCCNALHALKQEREEARKNRAREAIALKWASNLRDSSAYETILNAIKEASHVP